MKFSSRVFCLPMRVLGPLILATALIVHSPISAQEPIRVIVGNPDCSVFNVPAQGDVVFPVWVDFPYPVGAGALQFFIVDSVATEWLGINFLFPWPYNYSINGSTLLLYFFTAGDYPNTLFHLADIIFAVDTGPQYYGDTVQAITAGALGFSDPSGYVLYPDSHCVSPLCIERQISADDPVSLPENILFTAYPNPFNSSVAISLSLPREGDLNLTIYDITGRVVRNLYDGKIAGNANILWDGADKWGQPVASGVYFYRIEYEERVYSSKMTSLR